MQPQDDIIPWNQIYEYRDELNNHFEDITARIILVGKEELSKEAGEQLNKKSLVKFHDFLSKFLEQRNISSLKESEIDCQSKLEKVLDTISQFLKTLSVQHA